VRGGATFTTVISMRIESIEDTIKGGAGTVDDVVRSLRELRESLKSDPGSWENGTLERYLEAMAAWLEAVKGRGVEKASWGVVVGMLEAGKIYE
jgi:hypothetical protein